MKTLRPVPKDKHREIFNQENNHPNRMAPAFLICGILDVERINEINGTYIMTA